MLMTTISGELVINNPSEVLVIQKFWGDFCSFSSQRFIPLNLIAK